ncbi:hypothetical protein pb186bvf_014979 [Paramecium bursaria]
MQNYDHIYSKERIDSFISKYKDQVNIDPTKQIKCGIINIDEINIAVDLIQKGYLVAFPTETVYGLGANALNPDAILSIFSTKRRPLTDPLIVHVHSTDNIYTDKPPIVDILAKHFWPGPFTIVLKSTRLETTSLLSANTGSIGIRIPNNYIALQLLQLSNLPIAAPSANLFTHISPTSPIHVFNDFYDQLVHIIDGPRCQEGIESTIVKPLNNQLQILRLGSLAKDKLNSVIQQIPELQHFQIIYERKIVKEEDLEEKPELKRKGSSMEAPGQLLKHYSANINTYLLTFEQQGQYKEPFEIIEEQTIIVDFGNYIRKQLPNSKARFIQLSETCDAKEAMYNLYDTLRWAEIQPNANIILLFDFERIALLETTNDEYLITIADKTFRSASGLRILYEQENKFSLLI